MSPDRLRRIARMLLLPLLLAALSLAPARVFVCPGDGTSRQVCCCSSAALVAPSAGPSLHKACCCTVSEIETQHLVAETQSGPHVSVPVLVADLPLAALRSAPVGFAAGLRFHTCIPPQRGERLTLLKRSLLI